MQSPTEFNYLWPVALKYRNLYLVEELKAAAIRIERDPVLLQELRDVYDTIDRREDAWRISRWCDGCTGSAIPEHERDVARQAMRLFTVFDYLAKRGLAPFSSGSVRYIEIPKKPNWQTLPRELEYLIEPASIYGVHGAGPASIDFLSRATDHDLAVLAALAEKYQLNDHAALLDAWFDRHPLHEHQEAWMVYCLFGILANAGLI